MVQGKSTLVHIWCTNNNSNITIMFMLILFYLIVFTFACFNLYFHCYYKSKQKMLCILFPLILLNNSKALDQGYF